MTIAVRGMAAHELEMRELVAFVELDECLPLPVEPEKVEMTEPELLAPILGPGFVAVLRKQLAAVQRERFTRDGHVLCGERASSQFLEPQHVDRRLDVGQEHNALAPQHDRIRHVERTPREVGRLVQLRGRLVERVVRPEQIDDLLTMKASAGRHREDLHERGRVPPRPASVGDRLAIDRHAEPSEQRDVDHRHSWTASFRAVRHPLKSPMTIVDRA